MATQKPLIQGARGLETLTTGDVLSVVTAFTGELKMMSAATTPTGWLTCDGSAVSRTTYAALFSIIGTTFGVGDGSTTFNLPDMRDRFPVGASGTKDIASTSGTETVTLEEQHIPGHNHAVLPKAGSGGSLDDEPGTDKIFGAASIYTAATNYDTDLFSLQTTKWGGAGEENTAQPFSVQNPYLAVHYIICWNGLTP